MANVLFLIMSDDAKFDFALRMAYNSVKAKRYEDLKIVFFGPSQKRLAGAEGALKTMIDELVANKVIDSACVAVAENMGIKPNLEKMGVQLLPAGERVAHYVNQGYEVITF